MAGAVFGEVGWGVMLVAPRIVNNVSYVTRIDDVSHFAWQAQHLCWRMRSVAPRIVNDVSYVTRINDASHSSWQAQHLVRLKAG